MIKDAPMPHVVFTSPLSVAALYDWTGDWHIAFGLVIAIWLASAACIGLALPPKPRDEAAEAA